MKEIEIKIFPDKVEDEDFIKSICAKKCGVNDNSIFQILVIKKSIDARGSRPFFLLKVEIYFKGEIPQQEALISSSYQNVNKQKSVVIVGAGPAGYFAALEMLALGLKPIVLDRGKDVQARRRDLKAIQQDGIVNPHSNYCFGEGGAGTYSDGKLYTRSHKRGSIIKVLRQLVEHGATSDILIEAHPHIGSNKLPNIVAAIRETIIAHGGEVHFDSHVTDFEIENSTIKSVITSDGKTYKGEAVILATGHSARDIYHLLYNKGVLIESKPFALGVRIEHKQSFIDWLQYGQSTREEQLPAASYKTVCQIDHKGVFSFCMCPGGLVVPAATAPGEIVVNGMSLSRRDSPFANSGYVTSIELDELEQHGYTGIFASLDFQSKVERDMFHLGDGSQKAPAQRVEDFVKGRLSNDLFETSYIQALFQLPYMKLCLNLYLID